MEQIEKPLCRTWGDLMGWEGGTGLKGSVELHKCN